MWTLALNSFCLQSLHYIILQFVSYWHTEVSENLCLQMTDGTQNIWWCNIKSSSYLAQTNVTGWFLSTNVKKYWWEIYIIDVDLFQGIVWHSCWGTEKNYKMTKSWSCVLIFGIDASRLQVSCVSAESGLRIWHSEDRASWYLTFRGPCNLICNKAHYFSTLFW